MCDVAAAISAAVTLISSDSGGGSYGPAGGSSDAAGQAALRAVGLSEADYAASAPLRNATREAAIRQLPRAEAAYIKYTQVEDQVIADAKEAGSPTMQEQKAAAAQADVNAAADAVEQGNSRRLSSLGLAKPGDAAFGTSQAAFDLGKTATLAHAGTQAREGEFNRGQAQRLKVAGMQKGFNPNASTTSAGDVANTANTLQSVASSQASLATAQYNRDMEERKAVGGAMGEIATGVLKRFPMDEVIRAEEGGEIKGPSHAAGGVPIEAEGGEFIIKAETVKKYGPRLLREVNEGTAIIVPTTSPRRLKSIAGGKNANKAA